MINYHFFSLKYLQPARARIICLIQEGQSAIVLTCQLGQTFVAVHRFGYPASRLDLLHRASSLQHPPLGIGFPFQLYLEVKAVVPINRPIY